MAKGYGKNESKKNKAVLKTAFATKKQDTKYKIKEAKKKAEQTASMG
ncbi:MAG: hypothetical protein OXT65_00515 [Alphaproteobacteria bacterium]|nr:hypothetical protein [Alphaproteobacteria bacterium]